MQPRCRSGTTRGRRSSGRRRYILARGQYPCAGGHRPRAPYPCAGSCHPRAGAEFPAPATRHPAPAVAAPAPVPGTPSTGAAAQPQAQGRPLPKPGHVFIINLENKGYSQVWGAGSEAPYLSQILRRRGVLLTGYYATAHHSAPNYIAQISGQGSNPANRDDCGTYSLLKPKGTAAYHQVKGTGCVYPASVPTLPGQLTAAGRTWKGYMEDMGTPCRHPVPGADDNSQKASKGDQYATRHNPFVYFASITSAPGCQRNVVDFSRLGLDLRSAASTPNLSYITPNLCNDGHDSPCVTGEPGGLATADSWLRKHVPAILASPAYGADGLLVITFDESEGDSTGPAGMIPGGTAGGRIGALVLSPFVRPGTASNTPYNHFSLLASIEDIFGLPRLGYAAAPGLRSFGADVFARR